MTENVSIHDGYVVRYEYPGTTNGRPVGTVYVTGPHFGVGVYSHTYSVAEATKWADEDQARREMREKPWPQAVVIPASEAVDLAQPEPVA